MIYTGLNNLKLLRLNKLLPQSTVAMETMHAFAFDPKNGT